MADKDKNTVTLLAGGDIGPIYEPVDQIADLILPLLRHADLRFGQCERTYSERGWPEYGSSAGGKGSRVAPRMASIWKTAGIDIISMASNHAMDWGPEAALDTIALFRGMGKHVIGAGKDIAEARKPAIVERNGVKIAFLAYCSVMRDTQVARQGKAGCAPMRAHSCFAPEECHQPGEPPRVITTPFEDDLRALQEDIRKAKQLADVVVMSIHWGLHHLPKAICDYQPPVAHAAIDAGADLILGHHAHILKAVEVYKGKVCFYSMGNFMTTASSTPRPPSKRKVWNLYHYRVEPECLPPHGRYPHQTESRKTMVVKAVFSRQGVEKVSFLPAFINPLAQPAVVPPSDPKFQEILEYMEWLSDGFPYKFRVQGNEVVVDTAAA